MAATRRRSRAKAGATLTARGKEMHDWMTRMEKWGKAVRDDIVNLETYLEKVDHLLRKAHGPAAPNFVKIPRAKRR